MPEQIFISHITEDHELAARLKQRIEKDFLDQVDVFVSSDQESIQAGRSWLDAVRNSLSAAGMEIILCSPESITRPWINFEAGAGWLRDIPVVPLCHSGLVSEALPMPLSVLEGGKLSDPQTLSRLYRAIAQLVGCTCPDVNWKTLARQMSGQSTLDDLGKAAEVGDAKAIPLIAAYRSPKAWSILMGLAVDNIDNELKIAAIKGLASFHSPADIIPLCELLVRDRWMVAEECAKALGKFRNPAAIPYLIKASDQHVDWLTTQQCVTALGAFAPQQPEIICPALIRALGIGSFEGEASSQALAGYGSLALPYLLSALEKSTLSGAPDLVLKTIVNIRDQGALPRLAALRDTWQASSPGQARTTVLGAIDQAIAQLSETSASG